MDKSKQNNLCSLCHKNKDLHDSHLLAKGFYKIISRVSTPIVVTPSITRETSKQVKQYLLCKECEQMLSKKGEDYIFKICFRNEHGFKIAELLKSIKPVYEEEGISLFYPEQLDELDRDKIVYFASSVFWRASVSKWKVEQKEYVKINLGNKYQEQFRKFLLGEGAFPKYASLNVFIDRGNRGPFVMSPFSAKDGTIYVHRFEIPGIQFFLYVGKMIPAQVMNVCFHRYGKLFMADFNDGCMFEGKIKLIKKSRPSIKLLKENLDNNQ